MNFPLLNLNVSSFFFQVPTIRKKTNDETELVNKITKKEEIEEDAVENSPYKKKEKRTILPNVNKFNDKPNLGNSNSNNNNIIQLQSTKSKFEINLNSSKNGFTKSSNNVVSSKNKTETKHKSNNSHTNLNLFLNNNSNSKIELSPVIKQISKNFNFNDNNLNVIHSNSSNINLSKNLGSEEKLKIKIKVATKTKAGNNGGKTKTNQDSLLFKTGGCGLEGFNLFSVMDGHGTHGHFVSSSVKVLFSEFMFKNSHYGINTNTSNNYSINLSNSMKKDSTSVNLSLLNTVYNKIVANEYSLIKRCFQHCEASLAKSKYEVNFSGTTAVLVIQVDEYLICGNTGDSRAIVKTTEGIKNLSNDHKPDNELEKARIISSGGRVEKFNDGGEYVGPYRVWLKYEDYPGLAMSRSLGDFVSKSVGCSCIPEVIELKINQSYEYMVIASDGVWEFLDNEAVCKLVQPFFAKNDPEGACNKLIEESSRLWKLEDDGQDDITCIVVFFSH